MVIKNKVNQIESQIQQTDLVINSCVQQSDRNIDRLCIGLNAIYHLLDNTSIAMGTPWPSPTSSFLYTPSKAPPQQSFHQRRNSPLDLFHHKKESDEVKSVDGPPALKKQRPFLQEPVFDYHEVKQTLGYISYNFIGARPKTQDKLRRKRGFSLYSNISQSNLPHTLRKAGVNHRLSRTLIKSNPSYMLHKTRIGLYTIM